MHGKMSIGAKVAKQSWGGLKKPGVLDGSCWLEYCNWFMTNGVILWSLWTSNKKKQHQSLC